jgi:hypothetical protein
MSGLLGDILRSVLYSEALFTTHDNKCHRQMFIFCSKIHRNVEYLATAIFYSNIASQTSMLKSDIDWICNELCTSTNSNKWKHN